MIKFQAGKTYGTRSVCDYDCIISIKVAKRTAKTIVTADGKRLRVTPSHDGAFETVKPRGSYSMCPVVSAA